MKDKTCKDCKWANKLQAFKYLCLFIGIIFSDNEACEKFKERDNYEDNTSRNV